MLGSGRILITIIIMINDDGGVAWYLFVVVFHVWWNAIGFLCMLCVPPKVLKGTSPIDRRFIFQSSSGNCPVPQRCLKSSPSSLATCIQHHPTLPHPSSKTWLTSQVGCTNSSWSCCQGEGQRLPEIDLKKDFKRKWWSQTSQEKYKSQPMHIIATHILHVIEWYFYGGVWSSLATDGLCNGCMCSAYFAYVLADAKVQCMCLSHLYGMCLFKRCLVKRIKWPSDVWLDMCFSFLVDTFLA